MIDKRVSTSVAQVQAGELKPSGWHLSANSDIQTQNEERRGRGESVKARSSQRGGGSRLLVEVSVLIRLRLDRAHLTRCGDTNCDQSLDGERAIVLLEKQRLDVKRPEQKVIEWGEKNRSRELITLTKIMGQAAGFHRCR